MRSLARSLVVAVTLVAGSLVAAPPPAVIFIVLDTTRADRFSSLGNTRATTPALDGLAREGVLFRRHFANAHATRPSFPQFMSGRYYHQNVLRDFLPDAHPRELSFSRPDPTAILLPRVLQQHGYQTLGVSAHLWVTTNSLLGAPFETLETLKDDPRKGFVDADHVIDRGIALWRGRDPSRPVLLYLHLMDMHEPRFTRADRFQYRVDGYDWQQRFEPNGEPRFGKDRRRWDSVDARDFSDLDRQYFAAVYDSQLARTDAAIARLLEVVRHDDPELARTLVVLTADHGEELAEDGRTHHGDSLADGVQHIPWIVAGAGVARDQSCDAMTEHVDLMPTVLNVLGITPPDGTVMDGSVRIERDGTLAAPCGGSTVYFAWEDYRAIRTRHYLLEQRLAGSPRARCLGSEHLYRVEGDRRRLVSNVPRLAKLRKLLRAHLGGREAAFRASRYGLPNASFLVRTDFWALDPTASVRCVPLDAQTEPSDLRVPGWIWTGSGFAVGDGDHAEDLPISVSTPASAYVVELAALPVRDPPWFFGFGRWLRKSFLPDAPSEFLPLGTFTAGDHGLALRVPAEVARGHHVVGVRLTPPGVSPASRPIGDGERERLKVLGYVQ